MSDFDPEEFLEQTGIDVRLAKPDTDPPLSSAGAVAQAELLHCLAKVRAGVEIMESLVRSHPGNDHAFDALDQGLARAMAEAHEALLRLRDRRDCEGAA